MPFHAISNHHNFQDVKLLKEVRNPLQLDAYELCISTSTRTKTWLTFKIMETLTQDFSRSQET